MVRELVACELCSTFDYSPFLSTSGYNTPYDLVQCNKCGLVFMSPRPKMDLIKTYYQEEYFEQQLGSKEPTEPYLKNNTRLDQQRLEFVINNFDSSMGGYYSRGAKVLARKSILDVGCGCGTFLNLLHINYPNIKYNGIEPNNSFSNYAKLKYGLRIQTNNFEDFNTTDSFDIICFWQVINMVPNPLHLLTYIRQFLKEDGIIFIEVPNYLQAPLLPWKKRVYPSDPGQFFYFNKDTISNLLIKAGFTLSKFKYIEKRSWMRLSAKNGKLISY